MPKQTTESTTESGITWNDLEAWVRHKMCEWVQALLEAEVDALLGRRKSERRQAVDSALGAIAAGNYMIRVAECNGSGDPWHARS